MTLDENGGIAGEDGPAPSDKLTPPDVKKAELKTSVLGGKYYRVSFKNLKEEELAAYLTILKKEDKTEIQVNGRTYEYSSWSISSNDEDKYKVSEDESFGGLKYLDFSINGFNTEEENTVTIEAEGYDELSFAVYTDENGRVTEREEPDNNGAAAVPSENVSPPAKEPEPDVTVDKTEDSGNKAEPDNKEPEESDKESGTAGKEPETDDKEPETDNKEPETAGREPESDNKEPETAGKEPETDDKEPETAGKEPETDDKEPETAGKEPETDDKEPETAGKEPETDDKEPKTAGKEPETDDKEPKTDGKKPEVSAKEPEPNGE